ncbi:GNAT family N-acetyltransferase [Protofrankia symbiont of Coriaria ruscifolia]|uniref:N-acetyltransferase GCN5 n=1 Tax=Candidatus Protofrankia californiensis TaxID=1839754 RepID=A0A1C3NWR2_9ACTN|nr:GNAT family N-acetyltransferase [Protofrankia symbiont of Coriaria ruscifolia]SBW21570.1 N-acetyltransferase GCN5 [Candidatus Protofrankia californiensis]
MTLRFGEPTTVTIPTVVTDRLILRCWRPEDIGPYTAMAAHPDMSRYTGSPRNREAVWDMEAALTGHWHLCGFGMWAAEDRSGGEFVGRAGLYQPEGWPGLEVAWTIRRDLWGRGLATEAGAAVLDFAFTRVGANEVISLIHPDNAASIRVAGKLGLADTHRTFRGDAIYAITRAEWKTRTGG